MYYANHLAENLRAASLGAENSLFLHNHQTGEEVSYKAFFANAERMAQALVDAGVKPGDRVAVQAAPLADEGVGAERDVGRDLIERERAAVEEGEAAMRRMRRSRSYESIEDEAEPVSESDFLNSESSSKDGREFWSLATIRI